MTCYWTIHLSLDIYAAYKCSFFKCYELLVHIVFFSLVFSMLFLAWFFWKFSRENKVRSNDSCLVLKNYNKIVFQLVCTNLSWCQWNMTVLISPLSLAFDTALIFVNLICLNVSHFNTYFLYLLYSVGKCQFMPLVPFTFGRLPQYFFCSFSWTVHTLGILTLYQTYHEYFPHLFVFKSSVTTVI